VPEKTDTFILVGGQGSRLSVLSEHRAKPAVPFAGKYRIIDFTLSNCAYSGLFHVNMLTQYRPRSLMEHVGVGKPWDLDRKWGGVSFLHPYQGHRGASWYGGTADALVQNLDILQESRAEQVLILSGDHVYKMNYAWMLDAHRDSGADSTVAVLEVPWEDAPNFGVLTTGDDNSILEFEEKPRQPKSNLASMGVYVLRRLVLIEILERLRHDYPNLDFGKHVIPTLIQEGRVKAYNYGGYWLDIGTVKSYHSASMDLLKDDPPLSLFDPRWHILTQEHNRPPTSLERSAVVHRSMITDGCRISGHVIGSVLGPGVVVEQGARVVDSVIMDDCLIRRDALVERCIVDKRVRIGAGAQVGAGDPGHPNVDQPDVLFAGITIIGKEARVPARQVVGTNCRIDMLAGSNDFPKRVIADGASIRTPREHHTVR
jgi:glucose-1-phosphate adenylyltransferase